MQSSVLYLFAHQDDELLILAKLMREVNAGVAVRVVWITDGGKGGTPAKREAESREVMRRVGVPDDRLHFLRFPDTQSALHLPAIESELSPIVANDPPTEIVSIAFEGGNMDHDVTAIMAARLTQRLSPSPAHYEYPLYNRVNGHRQVGQFLPTFKQPIETIAPTAESRSFMEAALKVYRTQRLGLWLMAIGGIKRKLLDRGVIYRIAPAYDFLTRPAGEPCDYEKSWFHPGKWVDWVAAVRDLQERYSL